MCLPAFMARGQLLLIFILTPMSPLGLCLSAAMGFLVVHGTADSGFGGADTRADLSVNVGGFYFSPQRRLYRHLAWRVCLMFIRIISRYGLHPSSLALSR